MRRMMVLGVLAVAALGAVTAAGAAPAPAPRVQMMVVGRTHTLLRAHTFTLRASSVTIGHRHCSVPHGTALAGLLAARLPLTVTDAAGCDPAALFVRRVGPDRNHGIGGWEYKVGRASPSLGAGDPAGRLRGGERLLWFWCDRAASCQRTLTVKAPSAVTAGASLAVTVLGYDDNGHGRGISGATVRLGSASSLSGAGGLARIPAPATPGRYGLSATKTGLIASFPFEVSVK
jgi:hypothetical protein